MPIKIGRQRLPCAVLRELLLRDRLPRCSHELQDLTLLWAAVQHAVLIAVRTDWPTGRRVSRQRPSNATVRERPSAVSAWQFQFAPAPSTATLVLPRATSTMLAGLTPEVVHAITRWAPPVVALTEEEKSADHHDKREPTQVPVLGNVVSAFLAKHLDPERAVWVRALEVSAPARFSLQELAEAAVPLLTPIVARHRDRIVRAAPTPRFAELVTGLQRAMTFRLRSRLA